MNDTCSGCGVCAGVCPHGCLGMEWNGEGEYRPVASEGCTHCGLCASVCPFENPPEPDSGLRAKLFGTLVNSDPICGSYAGVFKGYDERFRFSAASGGLATSFLCDLLEHGAADRVICAGRGDGGFGFRVAETADELIRCSGSVFYPLEFSGALRHILETEGRYAVIGLPCLIRALRRAAGRLPRLSERIAVYAGLACGHQVSKSFTEFLAASKGISPAELERVDYHVHDGSSPAHNYAARLQYVESSRRMQADIHLSSRVYSLGWDYFSLPACAFCDDIFADYADVSFMDAWLPGLREEKLGTSLVLVRNANLLPYFTGRPHIARADIGEIVASQLGSRVIAEKCERSAIRALLTRMLGRLPLKTKKVKLSRLVFEGLPIMLKMRICRLASARWQAVKRGEMGFSAFYSRLALLDFIRRSFSLPYAVFYNLKTRVAQRKPTGPIKRG